MKQKPHPIPDVSNVTIMVEENERAKRRQETDERERERRGE